MTDTTRVRHAGEPELMQQQQAPRISLEQLIAERLAQLNDMLAQLNDMLVMVKSRCVELENAQPSPDKAQTLDKEQYLAPFASNRNPLAEHHNILPESQHPSASSALNRIASTYAMPARMWRHGMPRFLELLRQRLPSSLEYMVVFVYLAYSMIAVLRDTAPECLDDLGQYRKAIEDYDWADVTRYWYTKASDGSPGTRRLHHNLAILALPAALYYAKLLCLSIPFLAARQLTTKLYGLATGNILRDGPGGTTQRDRGPLSEQLPEQFKAWPDLASLEYRKFCLRAPRPGPQSLPVSTLARVLGPQCPPGAPSQSDVDDAERFLTAGETPAFPHTWPGGEEDGMHTEAETWRPRPCFGTRVSLGGRVKRPVMLLALFMTSAVVFAQGPNEAVKWGTYISGMLASVSGYAALRLSPGPGVHVQATWYIVTTTCMSIASFAGAVPFVLLLGAWLPRDERIVFHILQFVITIIIFIFALTEAGSSSKAHHWLEYVPLLGVLAATFSFLVLRLPRREIGPGEHGRRE